MTTTTEYTFDQLTDLVRESSYGDDQFAGIALEKFHTIIRRGDGVAVYENHDLGHPELGHRQYVSYGSAQSALGTVDPPPQRLPDWPGAINWRYTLIGTCRSE